MVEPVVLPFSMCRSEIVRWVLFSIFHYLCRIVPPLLFLALLRCSMEFLSLCIHQWTTWPLFVLPDFLDVSVFISCDSFCCVSYHSSFSCDSFSFDFSCFALWRSTYTSDFVLSFINTSSCLGISPRNITFLLTVIEFVFMFRNLNAFDCSLYPTKFSFTDFLSHFRLFSSGVRAYASSSNTCKCSRFGFLAFHISYEVILFVLCGTLFWMGKRWLSERLNSWLLLLLRPSSFCGILLVLACIWPFRPGIYFSSLLVCLLRCV